MLDGVAAFSDDGLSVGLGFGGNSETGLDCVWAGLEEMVAVERCGWYARRPFA